jgi:hypothetical protein
MTEQFYESGTKEVNEYFFLKKISEGSLMFLQSTNHIAVIK